MSTVSRLAKWLPAGAIGLLVALIWLAIIVEAAISWPRLAARVNVARLRTACEQVKPGEDFQAAVRYVEGRSRPWRETYSPQGVATLEGTAGACELVADPRTGRVTSAKYLPPPKGWEQMF